MHPAARDVYHSHIDPSDILLTDQVAIVTGGGGGIGLGTALGLARFGADVAVLDIVPDRCAAAVAAIEELGRRALGIPCDVSLSDQVRAAIADVFLQWGRVDILINNAGGVRAGPFLTQPEASMRRHVDINLMSALVATQEAARCMIEGGRGGAIVNVASIEGSRAAPSYAVYAACKAAMLNFARTIAVELGDHGIRINCISPDKTITPGLLGNRTGSLDPASWPEPGPGLSAGIPLGRPGLVDECAAAAVWLCSKMSSYVTGVNIPVDGGTWASSGWTRGADGSWVLP
jgi:NAD(P)-dependent dehydrogenase (short-subunit alcohol dehydrogenase family)